VKFSFFLQMLGSEDCEAQIHLNASLLGLIF